ncbi:MAG TPA: TetR/AcrR family transcriptional regulator [Ktedonobacteraceae bacterium]|nr:TetR/AcrR family transcriptional regulator [Ktedonobacteraceae bacterium]
MSKGTQTKEMILERCAQLFSKQGYFGSSLADIMQETGLEKGGIYNHFSSKEELALESFDYAFSLLQQRMRLALEGKTHAVERLYAILAYFQSLLEEPVIVGGCPILNTAVEADDAQPALRERALHAMDSLSSTIERIVAKGIRKQELRPEIDVAACATLFVATLEGAVMMSKLYRDTVYMKRAVEHLRWYIDTQMRG